jgi:hypothetical protein
MNRIPILTIVLIALSGAAPMAALGAEPYDAAALAPLLKELPKSKLSLADGIRLKSKAPETAISAKFELKGGRLMLSVYTAEKGLGVDSEHNVLKEYLGSPEGSAWTPEVEVFEDVPHVARSAMQLTLLAMSPNTLLDILQRAAKDQPGTVFSVIPRSADRKQVIEVLVADQGKVNRLRYDVLTGKLIDRARL